MASRVSAPAAPKRPRARRGEGERLRDEIMTAAEQLLDEVGDIDKVSIRMVADRIGRTPPSIYLHFPDKSSLMVAVCAARFETFHQVLLDAISGLDDPVAELRAVAHAYVRFATAHPEEYRVLFLSDQMVAGAPSTVEELSAEASLVAVAGLLQRAVDAGTFRSDKDPALLLLDIWSMVHGIASILVVKSSTDWPAADVWVDDAVSLIIDGLRAR